MMLRLSSVSVFLSFKKGESSDHTFSLSQKREVGFGDILLWLKLDLGTFLVSEFAHHFRLLRKDNYGSQSATQIVSLYLIMIGSFQKGSVMVQKAGMQSGTFIRPKT